jgi:antitoxin FitA
MGDLLIRNLDRETKSKLLASAQSSGRSLSDEAALRLRQSLATEPGAKKSVGQRLRHIIDGFALTESEHAALAASRHEPDREPPSFGSGK